ncbi:MAG: hypothetical protein LBC61_05575 [Candidatus Peribacteria bacterium]|nr:hypothetical protein [Candidatus Peribacteria bacterium]
MRNKANVFKNVIDILYSMNIELDSVNSKKLSINEVEWSLDLRILDYDYLVVDRFIDRVKIKLKDLFVGVSVDGVKR